jgi:hypothetical protein
LRERDPRDYIDPLINLLRKPVRIETRNSIPGAPGASELIVENERYIHKRYYIPNRRRGLFGSSRPTRSMGDDLRSIKKQNGSINDTNARASVVLASVAQVSYGVDRDAWKSWGAEQQGYTYTPSQPVYTRTTTQTFYIAHHSCFGKGTPVHTIDGTRAIEDLKVGDRVLAQDTKTGALGFEPVVAVYHNSPAQTRIISLEGEVIVTTGIHRFWKAGTGWTMARDLKPGDRIRARDGYAKVLALTDDPQIQPVFNLEVAETKTFFVGERGVLAHDFSLVDAVTEPFDAVPSLASIVPGSEARPASATAGTDRAR